MTHNQNVPVAKFKENLASIINHPLVKAQSPNIILITPPPVEETDIYKTHTDGNWGGEHRKQVDAREYANAVKEVGAELSVPVLDSWKILMEKAGWKEGDDLIGLRENGRNAALGDFFYDGKFTQQSIQVGFADNS